MKLNYLTTRLVFLFLSLVHCNAFAVTAEVTHQLISETTNLNIDVLITDNGDYGIALGRHRVALLNLSESTLNIIQEIPLSPYKAANTQASSVILGPNEERVYITLEHTNERVDTHSLVFALDIETENLTFLRNGPALSHNALLSADQRFVYDANTYADVDVFGVESGPVISVFSLGEREDTLISETQFNTEIGDFLQWENGIDSMRLHGDGSLLSISINNPVNEYNFVQIFSIEGSKVELIQQIVPHDFIREGTDWIIDKIFLHEPVFADNIMLVSAFYSDWIVDEYRTIAVRINNDSVEELQRIEQQCDVMPQLFNPSLVIGCTDLTSSQQSLYQLDSEQGFISDLDVFDLEHYFTNLNGLREFEAKRWSDTGRSLQTSRWEDRPVFLYEFDYSSGLVELDSGLDSVVSNTALNAIHEFANADRVLNSSLSTNVLTSPNCQVVAVNAQNDTSSVSGPTGSPEYCYPNQIQLIEGGLGFFTEGSNQFSLAVYRIESEGTKLVGEIENALPNSYRLYNGTSFAMVDDKTLVFTASSSDFTADKYAVFELKFSQGAFSLEQVEVNLLFEYEDVHWANLLAFPNVNGWMFYNSRNTEMSRLFTREDDTQPYVEQSFDAYLPGTPSESGNWLIRTYVDGDEIGLTPSFSEEFTQFVPGSTGFMYSDDNWLVTHTKNQNLRFFRNENGEWTQIDMLPVASIYEPLGEIEYEHWHVGENHIHFVFEEHDQVSLLTVRWQFSAPELRADSFTIVRNSTGLFDILANDTDGDNPIDPSTVELVELPDNASASWQEGRLEIIPAADATGAIVLAYRAADTYGNFADPVTVNIQINEPMAVLSPEQRSSGGASAWLIVFISIMLVMRSLLFNRESQ